VRRGPDNPDNPPISIFQVYTYKFSADVLDVACNSSNFQRLSLSSLEVLCKQIVSNCWTLAPIWYKELYDLTFLSNICHEANLDHSVSIHNAPSCLSNLSPHKAGKLVHTTSYPFSINQATAEVSSIHPTNYSFSLQTTPISHHFRLKQKQYSQMQDVSRPPEYARQTCTHKRISISSFPIAIDFLLLSTNAHRQW
jgi:hypothetical protein